MSLRYRVISIGALGCHPLRNETEARRPSHATTTLIVDGDRTILVDPGLPAEVMAARLDERAGLQPDQIDTVFLTTFRPVHRRALALFGNADWFMHEPEIAAMQHHLDELAGQAESAGDADREVTRIVREERGLLHKVKAADERLTLQVHLFPAPGASPGSAALLLALPGRTVVVAGDAVLTQDHYEAGRIFEQAADVEQARASFAEIVEIADEIVPGHDNVFNVGNR